MADLAAALADTQTRDGALLTAAALANLLHHLQSGVSEEGNGRAEQLANDRDWLNALEARHGHVQPRSPVLDPAAWRLQTQLDQHGLQSGSLTSSQGPEPDIFLGQVFNRYNPRLAASVLPQLLWHMETSATMVWDDLLRQAEVDQELVAVLAGVDFGAGLNTQNDGTGEPPVTDPEALLATARRTVEAMAAETAGTGPPDPGRLGRLRRELLTAMPTMNYGQREFAAMLLRLGRLVDGLNEARFFHFAEGLLALVGQLEQVGSMYPDEAADFAAWQAELLSGLSGSFAREFAGVDPRLNDALAVAFDVSRSLARAPDEQDPARHAAQLADAVAKLALLIPDMDFYFDLPVRDPVAGGVDACMGIVTVRDPDGEPAMTRELFDDCQQTLVDLADGEAREAQLAGDPDGPFGESQLQRELNLTSGQRINYGIGYLHDRYSTGCEAPEIGLPNPLEWAYLATFMAWLSDQSPVYFQTPDNEQRLVRMRDIGLDLMRVVAEQVDCIAGAGASVHDPVTRVTADYRGDLLDLGEALGNAEREYRSQFLAPGADVALDGEAGQATAYRPDNLLIGPCDAEQVCEMSGELSSTRALLGLFPDPYLVADQTGMGKVEICYQRMEWVDRRSEPVRSGDENVANYFGRLAFDLKGRYVSQQGAIDLFAFRFRTPQEHLYMFAAAREEVLADSCPMEWIGTKIVTTLPEGRRAIVPNRLTYLSASRTLPSRLLSANWGRGAEWRDWFVTGIGVEEIPVAPLEDISSRLSQHLQSLYRLQQEAVYGSVLQTAPNPDFASMTSLYEDMMGLTTSKNLVRTQMMLFYPQVMNDVDALRSAVAGHDGLLDVQVLGRFRKDDVPVGAAVDAAHDRLQAFQAQWRALPEVVRRNGSIAESLSHALVRLNALYDKHFARPAEPRDPPPKSGSGF